MCPLGLGPFVFWVLEVGPFVLWILDHVSESSSWHELRGTLRHHKFVVSGLSAQGRPSSHQNPARAAQQHGTNLRGATVVYIRGNGSGLVAGCGDISHES